MRIKSLKKTVWILCCIVSSIVMLAFNFLPYHIETPASAPISEDVYDPLLVEKLQNIDGLIAYADSVAASKHLEVHTIDYWNEMASILRYRFYHGYSYYTPADNWLAWLAGKIAWSHLHAIVLPNHIMKYPRAACSQQSIVMMECMKRKGIPYRSAEFAHHYALEGKINGKWRYFDTNMEPHLPESKRRSLEHYIRHNKLVLMYAHKLSPAEVTDILDFKRYGEISAPPAPQAAIFHRVTLFLSRTLWILPLIPVFYIRRKKQQAVDTIPQSDGAGQ